MRLRLAITIVSLLPAVVAQRVTEASEPNQTLLSATVLACGEEAIGGLSSAADEDWYRIVIATTSDLRLSTGPTTSADVGDTVITLLDNAGAPLRANDDGVGTGLYSQLYVADLPAGTYYAAVTIGANAAASGGYLLDVSCQTPFLASTPLVANEGPENNDPRSGGTATSVIVPARCSGNLATTGPNGDWDFWKLLVLGDNMLRMRLLGTASHPNLPANDVVLYLVEAQSPYAVIAGPFFASDRDEWDQAIDVRLRGGLYHAVVRGVEGSQAGDYYLDCTMAPASSATVHPGGCGGRQLSLPTTNIGTGAPLALESAYLATTYAVEGLNLGGNGFAFHVVGLQSTFVDLTPFGAAGCALEVVYLDTAFQFADASGRATWTVLVPDNPVFLGTTLHSQAAVLDLSNPLGITISNRVSSTVGY